MILVILPGLVGVVFMENYTLANKLNGSIEWAYLREMVDKGIVGK